MKKLLTALGAGSAALVLATGVAAAQAPPPPTAANGAAVSTVGHVDGTPTTVARDSASNTVFVGTGPNEETGKGGGIVAFPAGAATGVTVPGVQGFVFGLAQDPATGTLYASVAGQKGGSILALSQWNGTSFGSVKTIFNAAKTVGAVNGIALGPDGRLYGGASLNVDVNKKGKLAKRIPYPHPFSVFSINTDGSGFKVVSRGLRQPWQMTFPQGATSPYVTVLSQEVGKIPPDAIVVAKQGTNFGFPGCFLKVGIACKGKRFSKPLVSFPPHSSPMGIGSLGTTLYVALFGKMEVDTIPVAGGKPTPFLTKFVAPVVLTNVLEGTLYAGDLTGTIYSVALS
jgi:glucose/arabinose dehydrogenase